MTKTTLPLEGVRVADFSRVLAGPYCSMLLADLGADVVKVEHPRGDETRAWGPPFVGSESAYYLSVNRNKRSLRLDLKREEDLELAYRFIRQSDVLLHNFKPGDAQKLGLDRSRIEALNPNIVYAHISGYGSSGPDAHKPGYDLLAQAVTGFMSITGDHDGEPRKVGVAVIDVLAGLNAALGVVASLFAQKKEPRFREVETSLLEAGLSGLVNLAGSYLVTGQSPQRHGNAHPSIVPYQTFDTADRPIAVAAANDRQFSALCAALARSAWAEDERFRSNAERVAQRGVLVPLLQAVLLENTRAHWLERLEEAGVPCAPVNTLDDVFASAQVEARGIVQRCAHPEQTDLPLVSAGLRLDGERLPARRPPPLLGEHDRELRVVLEVAAEVDDEDDEALS